MEGLRPQGRGVFPCGRCSASCAPGSRTVHGCTCRESIADVGEKHLLREVEGRREANRDRHGVARGGPSFRRDEWERFGRTGARTLRATVTGNARGFARSQGRDRTDGRHLGFAALPPLTGWVRVSPGEVGFRSPDERREVGSEGAKRSSRPSAHGATEGVRGCDVRFGLPSRRAQEVCSQREGSARHAPHVWVASRSTLELRQTTRS